MSDRDSLRKAQHRLRLRELSKYYCVTSPLGGNNDEKNSDVAAEDYFGATVNFHPRPPSLAKDGILTALTQLAARKLCCQRSFISIIDDQTQYIIAEGTPSISFFDKEQHDPDGGLLLGAQPLPLQYGLCPIGLTAFLGAGHLNFDHSESEADTDHLVISDLLNESMTKDRPVVTRFFPHFRYFVEVPLRSDAGYVIGSICVIDPVTRSVEAGDVRKLQDIAKLVVQHLDWARMKQDHGRAERLIEGLSHFIQGKDSISDWSKATPGQTSIPNVYNESGLLSRLPGSTSRQNAVSNIASPLVQTPPTSVASTNARDTKSTSGSVSAASLDGETLPTSVPTDSAQNLLTSMEGDVYMGFDPPAESLLEGDFQVSASIQIRHAFSRASNLIRESMDLDATCFLEVPHNERFQSIGRPRQSRVSSSHSIETTTQSNESGASSDSSNDIPLLKKINQSDDDTLKDVVVCHRLGFSSRTKSSLAGSNATATYLTLPAKLVAKLTAKHPEGHIFRFDGSGSISSDDGHENGSPNVKLQQRKTVSRQLSRLFPNARSLVFLPLYDNDKQQLYAAFVGWTDNVTRSLLPGELNYVSGFTNSVMCEVMRLEATALDKAKSNFISSISHELRSPLHGILAANQLLSESRMYPQQAEFTQMVDTCARTLLDIMDHLLDHAKINHFVDRQSHGKRPKGNVESGDRSRTFSLVTAVDLLSVIEETAASMAASSNQLLTRGGKPVVGITPLGDTSSAIDKSEDLSPPIIMNFTWHKRWVFQTEAGSWRRIVMNLLGNSIKYTRSGYISIDLDFKEQSSSATTHIVELRIADTGQGISEEYLKHRLYTPFAQENNLSVGTGLGLSLVHQIVSSLKGRVQVLSEVDSGTEVIVQVPLKVPEHELKDSYMDDTANEEKPAWSTGVGFGMYGFENQPPISEPPTGVLNPKTKALMMMRESMASLLIKWFGMRQTSGHDAHVLVIEETFLGENLDTYDSISKSLLIIGMEGRGKVRQRLLNANYVYLLPPIGPNRLARSLKSLLQTHKERLQACAINSLQSITGAVNSSELLDTGFSPNLLPPSYSIATKDTSSTDSNSTETNAGFCLSISAEDSKPSDVTSPHVHKKEAILLVDDNDINLRILVATVTRIKNQTVEYITATNGQEALDRYIKAVNAGTKISVIFMDISMPVMDGFKSTRAIRAYEKAKGFKKESRATIVALTGLGSLEAQHEIDDSGFDVYLRKPSTLNKIREILPNEMEECE